MGKLTYRNTSKDKAYLTYGLDAQWSKMPGYDLLDKAIQKLATYEEAEEQGKMVQLPYAKGTFVKIANPFFERKQPLEAGTIVGYNICSSKDIIVCISGYKESWYGEYMLEEIEPMMDEEVKQLKCDLETK